MRNGRIVAITALFALVLLGLLGLHISEPWQYSNDDNGAWFSAIARTHLLSGLSATRGQDFFTSRATGELVPYLHHPPLPGLVLAAVFVITGHDSPTCARAIFAILHLLTFLIIARLAALLLRPGQRLLPYLTALLVAATVPMSAFYGKMPDHEVPGLLFFVLGIWTWGFPEASKSYLRLLLAWAAWALAIFASWHAAICILLWLGLQYRQNRRWPVIGSLMFVVVTTAMAGLHLLWAGHGKTLASQGNSFGHWLFAGDGASFADSIGFLQHALGAGIGRYAYLPALLAIVWLSWVLVTRIRTSKPVSLEDKSVLGLCLGSIVYALIFPRAVNNHAYQGFYLIPFVALASGLMIQKIGYAADDTTPNRRRSTALAIMALIGIAGVLLTLRMYRKPSARAVQAAHDIQGQYR